MGFPLPGQKATVYHGCHVVITLPKPTHHVGKTDQEQRSWIRKWSENHFSSPTQINVSGILKHPEYF